MSEYSMNRFESMKKLSDHYASNKSSTAALKSVESALLYCVVDLLLD